jgi:uncharacterized protein YndB with AHSA1/START domain
MIDKDFGERIGEDGLRFERRFAASIESVWNAVITPAGLAGWLGRATVEARPGGRFQIDFDAENRMDGRILELEAPHLLVLAWHETANGTASQHATRENDESIVRFELTENDPDSTTLVFTHRYIRPGEQMLGFSAGWHAHLTSLAAVLHGTLAPDREALYERLREPYESRLSGPHEARSAL